MLHPGPKTSERVLEYENVTEGKMSKPQSSALLCLSACVLLKNIL